MCDIIGRINSCFGGFKNMNMEMEYNNQYSKYQYMTKEEVKNEVFANAVPFDEEAYEFILNMYYDTFKALVDR